MKKFLLNIFLSIALLISSFSFAYAENNPKSIAVLDMQKIVEQSLAAADVRTQVKEMHDKFGAEIKNKQLELQKEDEDLAKKRSVLSAKAYEEKRNQFKDKYTAVQRDVQVKREAIDKSLADALNVINNSIQQIVSDLAKSKNFDLAIYKLQVAYVKPEFDITNDVLQELNKKLPKVQVQAPVIKTK